MAPVVVCCLDSSETIQGLILGVIIWESGGLKGKFSSRTVVYGGPLIGENHKRTTLILKMLVEELIHQVSHESIFIQFRASHDLSDYDQVLRENNFKWHPRLNLLINTNSEKEVWHGISSGRRRQIRKSLSGGAKIIQPERESQVREFYDILYDLYKHKVKKPLPDWSFFQSFYRAIYEANQAEPMGRYFLIEYDKKIVGGILCPFFPGGTVFEWYVCGLDQECKEKGVYPSVLATWAAIDFAVKNGYTKFDFMGVGIPGKQYGVRDFKMKFGGHQVNHGRYTRINKRWLYVIAELGYNFLSLVKKI